MVNAKDTKIYDFGVGDKNNAKFSIEMDIKNRDSNSSTNSTKS